MDKVLIATPYFHLKNYCIDKYLNAIQNIKYNNFSFLLVDNSPGDNKLWPKKMPQINWDIINLNSPNRKLNSREVLSYCYSVIFSYAEGYNFDYLLTLECDVIPKPNILLLLLETSKKYDGIICGLTERNNGQIQAYKGKVKLWNWFDNGFYKIKRNPYKKEELNKDIIKIDSATFSCTLIPIKYLKNLKVPWNIKHYNHPDIFFYEQVQKLNIPIWLDTRVKCEHLQQPWNKKEIVW